MEYFFYCRDRSGSAGLREELAEAHWSFMDGYAGSMIARGPTLNDDRTVATGSMHMVELADAAAAEVFAFHEPYYRAGVYADVLVRRWRNTLGRTMWDFAGAGGPGFLIIGHAKPWMTAHRDALRAEHRRYVVDEGLLEHSIARGPLLSDDGTTWLGSAAIMRMSDHAAVDAMLAREPYTRAGLYETVEVHNWQPGGRPSG